MNKALIQNESRGTIGFVVFVLFAYALIYRPFITWIYVGTPVRIGVEGIALLILVIINMRYNYNHGVMWSILLIVVFCIVISLDMDSFVNIASTVNKWVFLTLVTGFFVGNRSSLYLSVNLWIKLSYILCIMSIVAFIGYESGEIPFHPIHISNYYYLHNPILGNLIPRGLFGIEFGRVAGFMHEGQYMGFFLGMNILLANEWIDNHRKRRIFVLLNVISGLFTLSTTFFAFFALYFFSTFKFFGKKPDVILRVAAFFFLASFLIIVLLRLNYFEGQTSAVSRMARMNDYWNYFIHGNWIRMTLGYGSGVMMKELGIGFDSGWFAILVDHGIIMLVIMASLIFVLTKHNPWLLFYVFLTHFADNMFWCPLFLMLIAMSYAYHKDMMQRIVIPESLPQMLPSDGCDAYMSSSTSP